MFATFDEDGSGAIEYGELQRALNVDGGGSSASAATSARPSAKATPRNPRVRAAGGAVQAASRLEAGRGRAPAVRAGAGGTGTVRAGGGGSGMDVEDDDHFGDGEDDFGVGVRRNAQDFAAQDVDQDNKLDFDEFCAMVREREESDYTDEELRARFAELDADGSGKVDMHEYIRWALRDALVRSSSRVIDLFRQWDDDGSGTIDKKEFRRAIRALGFDFFADVSEIDMVFDDFDTDGSGSIDYKELNKMLRQGASVQLDSKLQAGGAGEIVMGSKNKHKLRKHRAKGKALPSAVTLKPSGKQSVKDQLIRILKDNAVRVIDLFREWDEDADGLVSKKEFRQAISALGYNANKADLDAVFATFDEDGSGDIEYGELQRALGVDGGGSSVATSARTSAKTTPRNPGMRAAGGAAQASSRLQAGRSSSPLQRQQPQPPAAASPRAAPTGRKAKQAGGGGDRADRSGGGGNGYAGDGGGDPYAEVSLLVEAAPLPLHVVGMPTGEDDMWSQAGGLASRERLDHAHGRGRRRPPHTEFEEALRARLEGLLVGGSEAQLSGQIADVPKLTSQLRERRERARSLAREDSGRLDAAALMQRLARGWLARRAYDKLRPKRQWKFSRTYRRSIAVGDPSRQNTAVFQVQRHEQLDLMSAIGSGRLLLDAIDHKGQQVVAGSCVHDTSLQALVARPSVAQSKQGPGTASLCSAPGEYMYTFTVEPLTGQDDGHLDLTFCLISTYTDDDLISEPEPRVRDGAARLTITGPGAASPVSQSPVRSVREQRREELAAAAPPPPTLKLPRQSMRHEI